MFNNRKRKTEFRPLRPRDWVTWQKLREASAVAKQQTLPFASPVTTAKIGEVKREVK